MQLQATLTEILHEGLPAAGFDEVRPTHCQVLRRIAPDGSRLTDLAAGARMTKQSMSFLVDHLEACGYVERIPDRHDARVKLIRLTDRGGQAVAAIDALGARVEQEWAQKIGSRRVEQLRAALAGILD